MQLNWKIFWTSHPKFTSQSTLLSNITFRKSKSTQTKRNKGYTLYYYYYLYSQVTQKSHVQSYESIIFGLYLHYESWAIICQWVVSSWLFMCTKHIITCHFRTPNMHHVCQFLNVYICIKIDCNNTIMDKYFMSTYRST
jgi:hypothetical protein